jgi:hypothetical protein
LIEKLELVRARNRSNPEEKVKLKLRTWYCKPYEVDANTHLVTEINQLKQAIRIEK